MIATSTDQTTDTLAASLEGERAKRAWGRIVPARLDAVLKHAGRSILDIGCSGGAYVVELCRRGYDTYGVDLLTDDSWHGVEGSRFLRAGVTAGGSVGRSR